MPHISKIIGSPGCGKTDYLLRQFKIAAQKFNPERIGGVSFTKAAVEEMANRVVREAGVDRKVVKNIRTVHSLCFELLNMSVERVAEKKVHEFNESNPSFAFRPDYKAIQDDALEDHNEENLEMYRQMQVLRNRMVAKELWPKEVLSFYTTWMSWCAENSYMDFTAMIENAIRGEWQPGIDVLYVDESQD